MSKIKNLFKNLKFNFSNHYETLGVNKNSSMNDIKTAFRNKVK